ncbi:MAG: AMP-binding protein [Acidimicrobiales bacterium]
MRAWASRWRAAPAATLWFEPAGPSPGAGRWWNAGAFELATRRAAGRLSGIGLAPGDRVIWSTSSTVASLVAHVAALRAGLVVVPANTAYTERELAQIVADVRPRAAVVDGTNRIERVGRVCPEGVVVVGPDLDLPDADAEPLDQAGPDDPALICITSGTTGAPKGAVLAHRHLLAATESVRIAWRWTQEDRLVHCLPVFHAHGLCVGVYGTLLAGASAVLLPGFDPATVAEEAHRHRASMLFGVPTMYHRLLRSGRAADLRGLRLCVSGSAPLSRDLHAACSTAIGQPILERYGMTETLMNASNPYDGERRPGTVGFPLPGVEVSLAGDDEILVRGPNVFHGYWERPAANRDALEPAADGGLPWFHTGDLGCDEDGYLVIRGRSKELIISGGFNVHPGEVEEALAAHPRIAEVAVSGTPSDEWGEVVTAWVVPEGSPPTLDELAEFTSSSLAPYKRPRRVRIVHELPRNAMGKVVRDQLGA